MKVLDFLAGHPVFTRGEFLAALRAQTPKSSQTADSHLRRYLRAGRIGRVKQGVFVAVGPGETAATSSVDFLLVVSRLAPDAVLGYHTALEAHGYAQSVYERLYFLTRRKTKPLTFRGRRFMPVAVPLALQRKGMADVSTTELERRGLPCRVTSLERTAVDVLDRPDLAGGLEEVWRSLGGIPLLDLSEVLRYVRLRARATLAAKVGLFLDQHREQFSVPANALDALRALRPRRPHYMDRSGQGRLVASWNLMAPPPLVEGEWEAVR
ncbi:MAG: type IV toxin-antitoxin system AbiEi family antitoxin domain-containing protein [Thermoanaerobaculia bacterium]